MVLSGREMGSWLAQDHDDDGDGDDDEAMLRFK
jgi:hypothetical protein